jgi:hypothetical protein
VQTSHQRRRLLRELESEPLRTWLVLAKCGGGLAVIALIALIGAGSADDRETIARAKEAPPPAVLPAQAHRQQLFNERRARFARSVPSHNIASETSQRAAPVLPMLR